MLFRSRRSTRRHRDWLHANDLSWGKVGYALLTLGRFRQVEDWLGDWKTRSRAEPWMLHNLAWVLQRKGRDSEANEIIRHGLTLPCRDDTHCRFRLWIALEEALAGNILAARERVAGLPGGTLAGYDQKLSALVAVLLELQQPDRSRERFDRSRRQKLREFLKANRGNKTMIRVFHRSARVIARQSDSVWPIVWGYSQVYWPVLFGVLVVAAILVLNEISSR